jgi:hypothetical protein
MDLQEITKSPDLKRISELRVFSPTIEPWLRNFTCVAKLPMDKGRMENMRRTIGDTPSRFDQRNRQMIINDPGADELARTQQERLLTDSIAAHELGGGDFLGHFQTLLDLRKACPSSLGTQARMDSTVLFFAECGFDSKEIARRFNRIVDFVGVYRNSDWLFETYATAFSQVRRIQQLVEYPEWPSQVRDFLRRYLDAVESLDETSGPHGLGMRVYDFFVRKFKKRAPRFFDFVLKNIVVDFEGFSDRMYAKALAPGHLLLCLYQLSDADDLASREKIQSMLVSSLPDFRRPTLQEKSASLKDHLNLNVQERVWVVPIRIGKVWLALNSLLSVVYLEKTKAQSRLMIRTDTLNQIDTDALRLAIDLFSLRQLVMSNLDARAGPQSDLRYNRIISYLDGEITFQYLREQSKPETLFIALSNAFFDTQLDPYLDLPSRLKQYYNSHKEYFSRLTKDPLSYYIAACD